MALSVAWRLRLVASLFFRRRQTRSAFYTPQAVEARCRQTPNVVNKLWTQAGLAVARSRSGRSVSDFLVFGCPNRPAGLRAAFDAFQTPCLCGKGGFAKGIRRKRRGECPNAPCTTRLRTVSVTTDPSNFCGNCGQLAEVCHCGKGGGTGAHKQKASLDGCAPISP